MERLDLKEEEKLYVNKYMEHIYGFTPSFIDSGIDIPDCYFEFMNNFYAVEVTRYFQQNSEQQYIIYVKNIEKLLLKDNFFEEVYNRLGKKKADNITIAFYSFEELKRMIIENITFIKNISINNNYYFNEERKDYNTVLCSGCQKDKMKIAEFMDCVENYILDEQSIELELATKNKYQILISFQYCKFQYYGKTGNKKVIPVFGWCENEDELYNNIIKSLINKNNKLIKEYIPKLNENNIKYDYYNLVIYSEGIPAQLNEERLYNFIMQIENLKYSEIVIFLWKKIMHIKDRKLKIYNID